MSELEQWDDDGAPVRKPKSKRTTVVVSAPVVAVVLGTDSWASVADRYGVDVADLMAANGGRHRPLIAGEELALP